MYSKQPSCDWTKLYFQVIGCEVYVQSDILLLQPLNAFCFDLCSDSYCLGPCVTTTGAWRIGLTSLKMAKFSHCRALVLWVNPGAQRNRWVTRVNTVFYR